MATASVTRMYPFSSSSPLHRLLTGYGSPAIPMPFTPLTRLRAPLSSSLSPSLSPRFPVASYSSLLHMPPDSQSLDTLPSKLRDIVHLFLAVPESRAKYEQLLHYGKKLSPLPKEYQTSSNKVEGCVSQVWVTASLGPDHKVYFEAESDSLLTKGLAALLVEGLSGATPSEILNVSPDFIQLLGLNQSLTPSRSNGFFNMFKLMQKKALQLYMEAERGKTESSSTPNEVQSEDLQETERSTEIVRETVTTMVPEAGSRQETIRQKLETALDPVLLEVEDVSYQHAGHAGVQRGALETHFNIKIVTPKFEGQTLIKRHRMVYDLLQEEFANGLHALSIVAKTPVENSRS